MALEQVFECPRTLTRSTIGEAAVGVLPLAAKRKMIDKVGDPSDQQESPVIEPARSSVAQLARQRPRIMCSELLGRSQK
jgi:hypothetical protein